MKIAIKPPGALARMRSLAQTGPYAIALRFIDQLYRRLTGAPLWTLSAVKPKLLLGGQHYPRGYTAMSAYGIKSIVNMRESHHCDLTKQIGGQRHLHLPTIDNTPPLLEDLLRGVEFVSESIENGDAVYIHCGIGVGRAPTMAAAYLISLGLSPAEALRDIKRVRPFVHLTPAQRQTLDEFASLWARQRGAGTCQN